MYCFLVAYHYVNICFDVFCQPIAGYAIIQTVTIIFFSLF